MATKAELSSVAPRSGESRLSAAQRAARHEARHEAGRAARCVAQTQLQRAPRRPGTAGVRTLRCTLRRFTANDGCGLARRERRDALERKNATPAVAAGGPGLAQAWPPEMTSGILPLIDQGEQACAAARRWCGAPRREKRMRGRHAVSGAAPCRRDQGCRCRRCMPSRPAGVGPGEMRVGMQQCVHPCVHLGVARAVSAPMRTTTLHLPDGAGDRNVVRAALSTRCACARAPSPCMCARARALRVKCGRPGYDAARPRGNE